MKKAMSKVLSVLMAATLVFATAGVAFADSGETAAPAVKSSAVKTSAQKTDVLQLSEKAKAAAKENVTAAAESKKITPKAEGRILYNTLVTGEEDPMASAIGYTAADKLRSGCIGYSQAVTFPAKGTFILAAYNAPEYSTRPASFGIYTDAGLTNSLSYSGYVSIEATDTVVIKIPKAGTYYIGAYSSSYNTTDQVVLGFGAAYINGADRTVYNGKTIAVGQKDAQTNYFKYKATQSGYLKVLESEGYDKITLCDSSQKALSGTTYAKYAPTYGVKKDKTYYIKVSAGYNSDGGYQMKISNGKISEKSGTKKSRAVTLKKKTTKKGYILAGSSQADWYKFNLTGKKTVKITVKGATNDNLKVAVYKGGKKIGTKTFYYNTKTLTLTSIGKWSKGTYYIKVYRGNSQSSGWYSLYWK